MKNTVKKAVAFLMAMVMLLSLAACGSQKPAPTAQTESPAAETAQTEAPAAETAKPASFKKAKIGVGLYLDSGFFTNNIRTYLAALGEEMNIDFIYTTLTQNDEAANLTKVQELIAAGCDGIILTQDLGSPAIMKECADAGVYATGFVCDFNASFHTAYDDVFGSPIFLGTVADGPCGDDLSRQVFVQQFTEKIDEYNKTAETPIVLDPLDEAIDVLPFTPLDSTYFAKHEGIDAIFCFADGFTFVYPTMVSSNLNGSIKLFSAGYGEGSDKDFGSRGNGTFQQEMVSPIEAILYPVVLLVNKINGAAFADQPETAERRSCSTIILNSDEDLDLFLGHSFYITGNIDDAIYSPADVANMTAVANPEATYANLCAALEQMSIDAIHK